MAQFMKFGPLTADDIESGNANSGDVLTADGNGGSAFAASTGGGGAAFDQVVFTIIEGSIKLDLLSGGVVVDRGGFLVLRL